MRFRRRHGIDRATAEHLLAGRPGPAPGGLVSLLAAAAAPGRAGELAGEQDAMAAFRAARTAPVADTRSRSVITKVLLVGAVATTVSFGGVALAASTGTLPAPAQAAAHHTFHGLPAAHGKARQHHATGKPAHHPGPHATPAPSLYGLCQAYTHGVAASKGKALSNPAFTVLITAAGGKDQVATYCAAVLASPPATHPNGPPAGHPSGPPATHPTGKPSLRPTPPGHPGGH